VTLYAGHVNCIICVPYYIVVCDLFGPTIFFLRYIINGTIFRKRNIRQKMCFYFLYNLSELFLLLRRIQRDIITNVRTFSCKVPVILVVFKSYFNLLHIFSKNLHISNFIKILPAEAEFFDADRQTDRHGEVNSLFICNFANAPNDSHQYTDRNDRGPTEGFDTEWDSSLIIRCKVPLTGYKDGDCMVRQKHFNSLNTQCGQILNTNRPTHAYKLCQSSLCSL
jgi:hypothetical protein